MIQYDITTPQGTYYRGGLPVDPEPETIAKTIGPGVYKVYEAGRQSWADIGVAEYLERESLYLRRGINP